MSRSLQTLIRDLRLRRGRERRGLALAEGIRLVEEALDAGVEVRAAAVAPGLEGTARGRALKAALGTAGTELLEVSDAEFAKLADTEHPQGVVAVVRPPQWSLDDLAPAPRSPILALDGVQDPGNVGTIVRTALGLGAAGVVALPGTAELANPKVLRGSMGALFRLPAVTASVEELLEWTAGQQAAIWAAAMEGEDVRAAARTAPARLTLVLGNEGGGVGQVLAAAAERAVAIPLQPGAESLNVAVAAGILLYEVTRAD